MDKPEVSVIVPVYNNEKYLRRCIDSILTQSYRNFELILVNDGSTDNSGMICETYAKTHKNVVSVYQENAGVSAARNNGIKNSCGEYITFIDSDDFVEKHHLESMISALHEYKADIVVNDMRVVYANTKLLNSSAYQSKKVMLDGITIAQKMLYQNGLDGRSCGLLVPSILAKKFLFPIGVVCGEDMMTVFQYFIHSKKVVLNTEKTYNYFQNTFSVMHSASFEKLRDSLYTIDCIEKECKEKYPILVKAVQAKKFSNYCQALLEIDSSDKRTTEIYEKVQDFLLKTRIQILFDENTRIKNKLAALILLGGINSLKTANKIKEVLS